MANSYQMTEGTSNDIISYNEDTSLVLTNTKLEINIDVSNYGEEVYTLDYIKSIFDNLNLTLDSCKGLINGAKTYIDNNISTIPEEISQPDILDFDFSITGEISPMLSVPYQETSFLSNAYVKLKDVNSHLNLRSGSSLDSTIITSLNNNTPLKIIESSDPNWIKVETQDGQIGYVSSSYINKVSIASPNKPKEIIPSSNLNITGIVKTKESNLNLRSAMGIDSSIIGSLTNGTKVEVLDYNKNSNWIKVRLFDGKVGYVSSDYLEVKSEM